MSIEAAFFGTLSRDAENKTSKGGKSYLRMNVRTGDGDAAQWVSVMAFDPAAIERADEFTKGSRVYCEGTIRLDEWTSADGAMKRGLSCLARHARLSQIGRNKPPRESEPVPEKPQSAAAPNDFHDDALPF
jgi:single-stranded DNA-binding protein